jgi:hypothetical protein
MDFLKSLPGLIEIKNLAAGEERMSNSGALLEGIRAYV